MKFSIPLIQATVALLVGAVRVHGLCEIKRCAIEPVNGHVNWPSERKTIEKYAFKCCTKLKTIYIPPGVLHIHPTAFLYSGLNLFDLFNAMSENKQLKEENAALKKNCLIHPSTSPSAGHSFSPSGIPSASHSFSPSGIPSVSHSPSSHSPSKSNMPSVECFDNRGLVEAVELFFEDRLLAGRNYGAIRTWLTCKVTNLDGFKNGDSRLFMNKKDFDRDLDGWDVSKVTSLKETFRSAESFNGDISGWDIASVTSLYLTFFNAEAFNGDISGWDTSSAISLAGTLSSAYAFSGDISAWNTASAISLVSIFYTAKIFNSDINDWDVSSCTSLVHTFSSAYAFDGDISAWDTTSVTSLYATFRLAEAFNSDISSWDIMSVTSLAETFFKAKSFNGGISSWDISSIDNLYNTFYFATAFNQCLDWSLKKGAYTDDMFKGSPGSLGPCSDGGDV